MRTLFADSGYWIAFLHTGDQLHERARALTTDLGSARIVTTQMALIEVLDHLAGRGGQRRSLAVQMVRDLEARSDVEIVPQTDAQFTAAVERYATRPDQTWSLTDCASFLIMEERNITEALAYDRDFEQAGFTALLR
ncbi:MAG: PIN domain-containing protein [Chloroflexi bacterium]|nr:PIN domain-containing protein [Chloroflexota bacterium]